MYFSKHLLSVVSSGLLIGSAIAIRGTVTVYIPSGDNACGTTNTATDIVASLSATEFNTPNGTRCGDNIIVIYEDHFSEAAVADLCDTCDPGDIDLSLVAYRVLSDPTDPPIVADWDFI